MKRLLAIGLIFGLMFGAVTTAEAAKKKKKVKRTERVVEVAYQAPGIGAATPGGTLGVCPFSDIENQVCIEVFPEKGERYVKIEVQDAAAVNVSGFISQGDVDGDGISDGYGTFCTAHPEPVELATPAAAVRVSFYPGATADCAPSTPTTGIVVYTFSNLP